MLEPVDNLAESMMLSKNAFLKKMIESYVTVLEADWGERTSTKARLMSDLAPAYARP